jgi:succinate dehydrogenase/fumarate reductase flavoprotein subunit
LWEFLKRKLIQSGIKIMFETPGQELVQDAVTKRILGVAAEERGRKVFVKAKRAVVLCTGGFENDPGMVADYLHLFDTCTRGSPYNTGDGVRMAQGVGADLWHMANPLVYLGFKAPGCDFGFKLSMTRGNSFIYIGADNRRFINEKWPGTHHGKHNWHGLWLPLFFPLPIHAIFDEKMRLAGPINVDREPYAPWGWSYQIGGYVWSDDNSVEIEKGWIIKADTIRELAKKIDRDPAEVEKTVTKYNRFCAVGVDTELERGMNPRLGGVHVTGRVEARLEPIEKPPFYAIEAKPQILNTQGGPRRNKYAQVLDTKGEPIPGLYSAGELGSIYSDCYQGGGNVGECIAFGRIAGKGAASENPWK